MKKFEEFNTTNEGIFNFYGEKRKKKDIEFIENNWVEIERDYNRSINNNTVKNITIYIKSIEKSIDKLRKIVDFTLNKKPDREENNVNDPFGEEVWDEEEEYNLVETHRKLCDFSGRFNINIWTHSKLGKGIDTNANMLNDIGYDIGSNSRVVRPN